MFRSLHHSDEEIASILISVIITAFNRKKYVEQAIRSVLNQNLSRDLYEIILVKNFTEESVDKLAEKNNIVVLHSDEPNYGNMLLSVLEFAKGRIICFLEDDDLFTDTHLKYVYDAFVSNHNLGFLKGNYITFSDTDLVPRKVWRPIRKVHLISPNHLNTNKLLFIESHGVNAVISAAAIRKDLLKSALTKFSSFHLFDYSLPFFVLKSDFNVLVSNYVISKYRISDSWTHIITGNRREFVDRKIKLLSLTIKDYTAMISLFNSDNKFRKALAYNRTKMQLEMALLDKRYDKISDIKNYIVCSLSEFNFKRIILFSLYCGAKIMREKVYSIYYSYISR